MLNSFNASCTGILELAYAMFILSVDLTQWNIVYTGISTRNILRPSLKDMRIESSSGILERLA